MSRVIGIDLGTTNSCVAVIDGGKPIVIPNPGAAVWNALPFKYSTQQEPEPADLALINNGYAPRHPKSIMTIGGVEFSLLAMDNGRGHIYDAYVEKVGKARKKAVDELIKKRAFQKLEPGPGSDQYLALRDEITKATSDATDDFVYNDLATIIMQDPDATSHVVKQFGMRPADVISMLRRNAEVGIPLTAEQEKVFRVKGPERGALPAPRPSRGGSPPLRF